MRGEVVKAAAWGLGVTTVLAALIVIGSRNLSHFDAALVPYTFAILFATFGLTYRYAMWLQRPPTSLYWRRGWQIFLKREHLLRNARNWLRWVPGDILLNLFIWARSRGRGLAHSLIMWGCVIAVLITFPLVFGWLHFESVPGNLGWYRAIVFGFPTFAFSAYSLTATFLFHGLVWAALLVIPGVMLAMRRRMREEGAAAVQSFSEDFLPLFLLFAISLTGLMLTASYTWMKGYAYTFLAIVHAATVIFTFLWLPFGKFFHIFQRPAQIGVRFYKDAGGREAAAGCRRCGTPFTSRMHVEDLISAQHGLGYRYEIDGSEARHYQWICPPCRRALMALAQGKLRQAQWGALPVMADFSAAAPTPVHVNPAVGEGPLGDEDARNFHP